MNCCFRMIAATVVFCAGLIGAAHGTVADFIFDETVLSRLDVGTEIRYDHSLAAPENAPKGGFEAGRIGVTYGNDADGSGQVVISFRRDARDQTMNPLPTVGGNPLVMVFLESTARAMAGIAGGSPFYIRNRIKNALLSEGETRVDQLSIGGKSVEVTRITLVPFQSDPNRARMGLFADLEISFSYGAEVPGGIQELRAFVPGQGSDVPYYQELIRFESLEAAQ